MIKRLLRKYIWVAVILVYKNINILNKYLTNQNKYCIIILELRKGGKPMDDYINLVTAIINWVAAIIAYKASRK